MNKDQVKGAVKVAEGKLQVKVGKVVGSDAQRVKGLAKQAEGKADTLVGDARQTLKEAHRRP